MHALAAWSYAPPLRLAATFGPDSEVAASLREWVAGYHAAYRLNAEGSRVRVLAPGSSLTTAVSLSPPTLPRLAEHVGGWLHTLYGPGVLFDCQFPHIPNRRSQHFVDSGFRLAVREGLTWKHQPKGLERLVAPAGRMKVTLLRRLRLVQAYHFCRSLRRSDRSESQFRRRSFVQRLLLSGADLAEGCQWQAAQGPRWRMPACLLPLPFPRLFPLLLATTQAVCARRMSHALPPLFAAAPVSILPMCAPALTATMGMSRPRPSAACCGDVNPGSFLDTVQAQLVSVLGMPSAPPGPRSVCLALLSPFPFRVQPMVDSCKGTSHALFGLTLTGGVGAAALQERPLGYLISRAHWSSPPQSGIWPLYCTPFHCGAMTAGAQSNSWAFRAGYAGFCRPAISRGSGPRQPCTSTPTALPTRAEPGGGLSL